jgi:hypothetical protein
MLTMSRYFRFTVPVVLLALLLSLPATAEYEIKASVLGYKMILSSTARKDDKHTYIRFMQFDNFTPPFVLVETKRHDMLMPKIESQQEENKLVGRILLPYCGRMWIWNSWGVFLSRGSVPTC